MQKPLGVKIKTETGADKQNPKASIGFVLHYPFHYFVYKNIYKHIEEISEFIVDMGAFSVEQPPELLSEIILLLEKEKVFYRVLNFSDYYYKKYLSSFFKKYNLLVSVWESGCIAIQATKELKKVHVTYGAGKELTFLRPSQSIYDITLDFGERSANLHSYFSYPVITGNAKFDDWFNNTLDEKELSLIEDKLDKNKKTILYLPTHGDLSSVDKITPELITLSKKYNIIVKLHYYISREEPDRLKKLTYKNFLTYNDDFDLLLLLKKADVVLSDNSSAIFDAILADKPILATDYLSNDFLDRKHLERKIYRRGTIGALTYSNSIEQRIKRNGEILTITKNGELENKIMKALEDNDEFKKNRRKIKDELFSFNDGGCGKRGADAILELIQKEVRNQKTIMHHAMEVYKANIGVLSYASKDWLEKKVIFYEDTLINYAESDDYFFSVLVIIEKKIDNFSILEPLIKQNFPKHKFEIIIIDQTDKINWAPGNIKLVNKSNLSLGEKITEGIKISKGNIICFTTSSAQVTNAWLLMLYAEYKKNRNLSGCGGYRFLKNNEYFNYFYIQEIATKIGLGLTKGMWDIYNLSPVTNNNVRANPAGSLHNSSYKKKYIEELQIKNSFIPEIEKILKRTAIQYGPISFIISPATVKSVMTIKQFIQENIMLGFSRSSLFKINTATENPISVIEIFIYTLSQISKGFSLQNIQIIFIIFIGHSFRYVGSILALFYTKLLLFKIKIEDLQKE
jgi:hypothetical protein